MPVLTDYLSVSKRSKFGTFRNFHSSMVSKLPLTKCQNLKIKNFGIVLLTQQFCLIFLSTIFHERLSPKPVNHTVFCKN